MSHALLLLPGPCATRVTCVTQCDRGITYVWQNALLLSREKLGEANTNMFLEHLGSRTAFRARHPSMNRQHVIDTDDSARPQTRLGADVRRKELAEGAIGEVPPQPQVPENPRGEEPDGGGSRDSGSQESQPYHVSKNRSACGRLCVCQSLQGPAG